mmetsp:Transcript_53047/g.152892  ORF Transcript_53047/g.152892 Transcript_53047/m.152892 type:complete len:243 (-) Transcript_53047:1038-1766(-)
MCKSNSVPPATGEQSGSTCDGPAFGHGAIQSVVGARGGSVASALPSAGSGGCCRSCVHVRPPSTETLRWAGNVVFSPLTACPNAEADTSGVINSTVSMSMTLASRTTSNSGDWHRNLTFAGIESWTNVPSSPGAASNGSPVTKARITVPPAEGAKCGATPYTTLAAKPSTPLSNAMTCDISEWLTLSGERVRRGRGRGVVQHSVGAAFGSPPSRGTCPDSSTCRARVWKAVNVLEASARSTE